MLHIAQRGFGDRQRIGNAHQTVAHQGNRRCLNRDIAPAAHRNPDIRLRQRGCVVDAITDHRHLSTLALQFDNRVGFAIRQHACDHLINTCFFRNRIRGCWVIAG
ncbi:hypothetical protein D3C86_1680780 [compost metagenome]